MHTFINTFSHACTHVFTPTQTERHERMEITVFIEQTVNNSRIQTNELAGKVVTTDEKLFATRKGKKHVKTETYAGREMTTPVYRVGLHIEFWPLAGKRLTMKRDDENKMMIERTKVVQAEGMVHDLVSRRGKQLYTRRAKVTHR